MNLWRGAHFKIPKQHYQAIQVINLSSNPYILPLNHQLTFVITLSNQLQKYGRKTNNVNNLKDVLPVSWRQMCVVTFKQSFFNGWRQKLWRKKFVFYGFSMEEEKRWQRNSEVGVGLASLSIFPRTARQLIAVDGSNVILRCERTIFEL